MGVDLPWVEASRDETGTLVRISFDFEEWDVSREEISERIGKPLLDRVAPRFLNQMMSKAILDEINAEISAFLVQLLRSNFIFRNWKGRWEYDRPQA